MTHACVRARIRARTHSCTHPRDAWQESGYHGAVIGIALWPPSRHGSASHLRTDTHALKAGLLCVRKRTSERASESLVLSRRFGIMMASALSASKDTNWEEERIYFIAYVLTLPLYNGRSCGRVWNVIEEFLSLYSAKKKFIFDLFKERSIESIFWSHKQHLSSLITIF